MNLVPSKWQHGKMKNKHTSIIVSIFVICAVAACQTTVGLQNFPTMTFKNLPAINLVVSNIKILSKVERSFGKPNVTYNLSITPEQAVMQWARDRLATAGIKNTAQMIIVRADAREIRLKLDESILGVFKNQQSHRLEAFVEARLEILNEKNIRQAFVTAKAQQSITVSEATPISDRREIWYNLVEKLMTKFNSVMQQNIDQKLRNYLF